MDCGFLDQVCLSGRCGRLRIVEYLCKTVENSPVNRFLLSMMYHASNTSRALEQIQKSQFDP